MVFSQREFQVADRFGLLAPQAALVQRRHCLQPGTDGRQGRVLDYLPLPFGQRLGSVEGEYEATAGIRIVAVGKSRLRAGGFVDEGQRVNRRLADPLREPIDILTGLVLYLRESLAFGLCLDDTGGLAIQE